MPHVWSIGTGMGDGSVVQFMPGTNTKTKEEIEKIIKHPEVIARMESKVFDEKSNKMITKLEIMGYGKKEDESSNDSDNKGSDDSDEDENEGLAGMNYGDAVKLVKETYNTQVLKEWAEDESRKKVNDAIEKQLAKIDKERTEGEESSQE